MMGPSEPLAMAKICQLLEDRKHKLFLDGQWYYTPEDISGEMKENFGRREVFLSKHKNVNTLSSVCGKPTILPYSEYQLRLNAAKAQYLKDHCITNEKDKTMKEEELEREIEKQMPNLYYFRQIYDHLEKKLLPPSTKSKVKRSKPNKSEEITEVDRE